MVMVAYDDQLFILTNPPESKEFNSAKSITEYKLVSPEFYTFNIESEILSTIQCTTGLADHLSLHNNDQGSIVAGDSMYIFLGYKGLFEFEFPPKYPKCNLSNDYKKILESKLLCDVEFLVGEEEVKFPAHIPIIFARSDWLRNHIQQTQRLKLQSNSVPNYDSPLLQVKLNNIVPELFQMVLVYIYTNEIKPCKDLFQMLDFYKLAGEMRFQRIQQSLTQKFTDSLHASNKHINQSNLLNALSKAYTSQLLPVKKFCFTFTDEAGNYEVILTENNLSLVNSKLAECPTASSIISSQKQSSNIIDQSLKDDMKVFLETIGKEFSDFTLLLDQHQIPAHKCILAARCSYFEAMFRSFMPTNNTVRIQIGDAVPSKEAFDSLLEYIYFGEINLSLENSLQLVAAPSFFGFTDNGLLKVFQIKLKQFGTKENIDEMLEAASRAEELEFKQYILDLIEKRSHLPRVIEPSPGPRIWDRWAFDCGLPAPLIH